MLALVYKMIEAADIDGNFKNCFWKQSQLYSLMPKLK